MFRNSKSHRRRTTWFFTILALILFFSAVCSSSGLFPSVEVRKERREQRREKLRELFKKQKDQSLVSPLADIEERQPVGYKVLETLAPSLQGNRIRIDIAVWYPTADEPRPFQYVYGENRVATKIAADGKPVSGRFPLIIYSHGATGCGLSAAFLTERLAREGFVVAAPDYEDKYYAARIRKAIPKQRAWQKLMMLKWMKDLREYELNRGGKSYRRKVLDYRPQTAKAVIDRLLSENKDPSSPFYNLINEHEIGLVGHSFGAWTSILLSGGDPLYHESRAKVTVALSGPCNENVYERNELGNIHIPIMFVFGGEEPKAGRMSDRELLYDRANPPKFLVEIKGADHFTFSGGIRKEFHNISEYVAKDPRRAAIVEYTVAFFKYYLKKDKAARKQLDSKTDALGIYLKELKE